MATSLPDYEELEEEIKEFLQNYKHKKATAYEPCTLKIFQECLIGLHEELELFNISYLFNPYVDVESDTLTPEALVKLINAAFGLLHHHKDSVEKVNLLTERNHILETTNKQLNNAINQLKHKVNSEKNESRACVATAQRISDRSDKIHTALAETQAKLVQLTKQKLSKERSLNNEIARLKQDNEKLHDKLRSKSGSFTPCAEVCDATLTQLRERDRRSQALVAKLQANNHDLLQEIVALKEEIILSGLSDINFDEPANRKK